MWLSKRVMAEQNAEDPATLGTVSIGGKNPAVVTDAEKRQAKVISPGGYCWNPAATDCVSTITGGTGIVKDSRRRTLATAAKMWYNYPSKCNRNKRGEP